ncbi:hypothetical protein ACFE04_010511 [Oxalis oulophora]
MTAKSLPSSPSLRCTCHCPPSTQPGTFRCFFHKLLNKHPTKPTVDLSSSMISSQYRMMDDENSCKDLLKKHRDMKKMMDEDSCEDFLRTHLMRIVKPSKGDRDTRRKRRQRRLDFQPKPTRFSIMATEPDASMSGTKLRGCGLCSPSTNPGAFKCGLHRGLNKALEPHKQFQDSDIHHISK